MLGALLRNLEGAFADKGWHGYLLNLLADPLGLNLRNSISQIVTLLCWRARRCFAPPLPHAGLSHGARGLLRAFVVIDDG